MLFPIGAGLRCGGGEWGSNPPGTGSLPQPDLKSGRPTGDDSLPEVFAIRLAIEQIATMKIDAAQVPFAQGQTEPVEEVENFDGDLATVLDTVAEGGSGEPAVLRLRCHIPHDGRHLLRHLARKKMIVSDLVRPAKLLREFQEASHLALIHAEGGGEVAHPRRAEAAFAQKLRPDAQPEVLVVR